MRMIYEANASSSACRLWSVHLVETSTPPTDLAFLSSAIKPVRSN